MDPATLALLMGGGELAGSFLGEMFGGDDRDAAMRAISGVNAEANPLKAEDPRLKKLQMQALEQMYATASQGGMDPQAKAALLQAQTQNAAAERGARGAITQNAQARGVGGSGVEYLSSLANQQGAASRNNLAGTQAAGDARTRALMAMQGTLSGGGSVRGSDLNYQNSKAAIDQFNAAQRLKKAAMMAGQYSDRADRTSSMGGGLGGAAGGLYGYLGG